MDFSSTLLIIIILLIGKIDFPIVIYKILTRFFVEFNIVYVGNHSMSMINKIDTGDVKIHF